MRAVEHSIKTQESNPIRESRRSSPYNQRTEVRKEIYAMLTSDVIEPSNSPWSATMVKMRKKDSLVEVIY